MARCEHDQVLISVHNWGKGISPEVKKNLFLRFWQGVPGKTYVARTGLGLYLCDRIAQLHHGRIICESTEESGTEIGVRFKAYTE
jgi:signal transduction histidine kinase